MFCGKVWGGAPGQTDAMLLSIKGSSFAGGIRAIVTLQPQYTDRNLAIVANGIFLGAKFANYKPVEIVVPATPGNTLDSLYIEDIGRMSEVPEDVVPYILGNARRQDAITSKRLEFEWDVVGKYKQTTVFGDTQLSPIVITGAVRGQNVAGVPEFPARGRLHYSITNVAGTYIIRWWADTTLVAEGSRVGNGAVSCTQVENSGISVTCTIVYTGEVKRGTAWIDLKWSATFNLYWGTSPINYANPPQDTMQNNGSDFYSYVSAELSPGTYYWNVVGVDDEGQMEAAPTTPPDLITLNTIPDAPVITGVTQLSPYNFRVAYTAPASPVKTCYFSLANKPINFGNLNAGPAPVVGGASFVDITVAAYTTVDNTIDYAGVVSAFDFAVASTPFTGPGLGFPAAFTSFCRLIVEAALDSFSTALKFSLQEIRDNIKQHGDSVLAYANSIDNIGLTTDEWKTLMGVVYGDYIAQLGRLLNGNAARYAMPNGAVAGSNQAAAALGTSSTGFGGETSPSDVETLYSIAQPFVKPNFVRLVVRCSSGGIEEQNNAVYEIELDSTGNLKNPNPPPAALLSSSVAYVSGNDYSFTLQGAVRDEGFDGVATLIDVYIHDATTTFDPSTAVADATISLPSTGMAGLRAAFVTFTKTISIFTAWRKIILLARTAAGKRSATWEEQRAFHVSTDTPLAVGNLKGRALKSRGV